MFGCGQSLNGPPDVSGHHFWDNSAKQGGKIARALEASEANGDEVGISIPATF